MAGFQRDEGASQDGKVAIEIEIFGAGGVFFEEGVAHPVVADLATSPVATYQLGEALGALWQETAQVVAEGHLSGFAAWLGGTAAFGDHHQAAHMRQAAGAGLDGEDFDVTVFYASVPAILGVTGKRGESAAVTRRTSAMAVG
jgi:hypothetical protein